MFDASDVAAFCALTQDSNAIHAQESGQFKTAIVPGLFVVSMIPAVFSAAFPGAVYRAQDLTFTRSVEVGSVVHCLVEVTRVRLLQGGNKGAMVMCDTTLFQRGPSGVEDVVKGAASVFIPGTN
jgi:acyl dehydratase